MILKAGYVDLYNRAFDEVLNRSFKEVPKVYPMLVDEMDDKTKEWKASEISGTGVWDETDEAASISFEDPTQGYDVTLTQVKYTKAIQASFEAVNQEEDGRFLIKKLGQAASIGRGGVARVELLVSDVLLGGFGTACPDGQYLFDTDHPNNSAVSTPNRSNLLSGAFSHDALESAVNQINANYYDESGLPIGWATKPLLVYPSALDGKVQRVLSDRANERPGTTNRDINVYSSSFTPVMYRYLDSKRPAGASTGSDTAWFIIFPSEKMFKLIWSQRPQFTSYVDEDLELYKFKARMLCATGVTNWRVGFASTGL